MRTALTIAGSDSVGGAGIQADIKAMSSVGVHAASVITAITAQNTCEVTNIFPIPEEMIQEQIETVLKDCDIKAIKTGMLYSADIVEVVADTLEDHDVPLIIDPVMVATVGDPLFKDDLAKALKNTLLPMCEVVTPNKYEAEILSGMKINNEDDAMFACELIGKQGSSVLLKGGHMDSKNITDYLYLSSEFTTMVNRRLNKAGHGSGCILSSYITAHMAKGTDLVDSVLRSRELIQKSIATQYEIGKGELIVNPIVKKEEDPAKFRVLDALDSISSKILDIFPHELVPKNGMNIAYAMPGAAGPEDIAAIDKRIMVHNGMLKKGGPAKFGVAEHLSYVLLEVMRKDPNTRSIMNINYTDDIVDIMEEIGLTVAKYNKKGQNSIAEMTRDAISHTKKVPDAMIDIGSKKEDRMIRIFGKDPEDILSKLESIL